MKKIQKISIIIPVKNEEKNVTLLTKEILKACSSMIFEVIFINDGSTDNTENVLVKLKNKYNNLRIINHLKSYGQSAALKSGILNAKNDTIVTLDGDCQNDPADIPKMLNIFQNNKHRLLLIGGVRKNRKDNFGKRLGSKFGKLCRKFLLNDSHPDSGCGIKIFHKNLFLLMPYFDHIHRFLPVLAKREGAEVLEFEVNHRSRLEGNSNYTNFGRLLVGIYDVLGVIWLLKRSPKNFNAKEVK